MMFPAASRALFTIVLAASFTLTSGRPILADDRAAHEDAKPASRPAAAQPLPHRTGTPRTTATAKLVLHDDYSSEAVRNAYFGRVEEGIEELFAALDSIDSRDPRFVQIMDLIEEICMRAAGNDHDERFIASTLALGHQNSKQEFVKRFALRCLGLIRATKTLGYVGHRLKLAGLEGCAERTLAGHLNCGASKVILGDAPTIDSQISSIVHFLHAAAQRRDAEFIPILKTFLAAEDPLVRRMARFAISTIPTQDAADLLIDTGLEESDPQALDNLGMLFEYMKILMWRHDDELLRYACRKAVRVCPNPRVHRTALSMLSRVATVKDVPFLSEHYGSFDARAKEFIAHAAVEMLSRVDPARDADVVIPFLKLVDADVIERHPLKRQIRSGVRLLGGTPAWTVTDGIIREWWLKGAYSAPTVADWTTVHPPEQHVDLFATEMLSNIAVRWTWEHSDAPDGMLTLERRVTRFDKAVAYVYCELEVPAARDALLLTGSDDGLFAWVNGEAVLAVPEPRQHRAEQDRTMIRLKAGKNALLFKICEYTGDWQFSAHVVGTDGQPFPFTMH